MKPRSLMPREHGAYGQLFFPLLGALLVGRGGLAAIGLAVGVSALFFAHEPVLILLGQRGRRAIEDSGDRARKRLRALLGIAVVMGLIGLVQANEPARWAAVPGVLLAAGLGAFVYLGKEKTTAGEVFAAMALPWAGLVVALAGNAGFSVALWHWLVWSGVFVCATFAVRAVIARSRKKTFAMTLAGSLVVAALVAAMGAWAHLEGLIGLAAGLAAVPVVLMSLGLCAVSPHARYLRTTGWMLIGASSLTLLILVAGQS